MKNRNGSALVDLSDAELLAQLRSGDGAAYAELWRRHVQVALRVAQRFAPGRADDLVSESFLAVYRQVAVAGNGPESAFRAYLFTTMRNMAIRWQKQDRLTVSVPDVDGIELADASTALDDRARADQLLDAFTTLPARWQRILWLTEVEQSNRRAIATEFGIRPNAVSALYRRARRGLQVQWLTQQIPPRLREDPGHVARLMPDMAVKGHLDAPPAEFAAHLKHCATCSELRSDLVGWHHRMSHQSLAVSGFAGLGVVLTASSHLSFTAVGVTTAAALLAVGSLTIAATLGAGTLSAPVGEEPRPVSTASQPTASDSQPSNPDVGQGTDDETTAYPAAHQGQQSVQSTSSTTVRRAATAGRGNDDSTLPSLELDLRTTPNDSWVAPALPQRLSAAETPAPAEVSAADASTALRSGLASTTGNSYFAPILRGATMPGAAIAVELTSYTSSSEIFRYAANVAADGSWSLDLRPLFTDKAGTYTYRAWAYTDATVSQADTGQFNITAPAVTGFEGIAPFESLPLAEAEDTGIVFEATGPALGQLCLTSVGSGFQVALPLDSTGTAVHRIRFLTPGNYYLTFRVCEDGQLGPATEFSFDVGDSDEPMAYGGSLGSTGADTSVEVTRP